MVYKSHLIELWINGSKVELEDQKSLNMRFNNVITDPTKISSTQAEYSFEFEIPATPKNNVILDYANNLGKLNKFHQRYNAEVYADGTVIFSGTITINGFKDKKYNLNLVSVKVYSLDDIFGDSVLTDIPWYIPFSGVSTINEKNGELEPEVVFPLVSYGAFQKSPYYKDDVGNDYTSKFDFDEWNRWYVESFNPSMNMLKTLKKAFEYKGYTVVGDAFQNKYLSDIYMSTNLADDQVPEYNLGYPRMGKVDLSVNWSTPMNGSAYTQTLKFPYFRIGSAMYEDYKIVDSRWNFSDIQVYDMLSEGNVSVKSPSYLYQPNEHIIVIPADGFYKISLSGTSRITSTNRFKADQVVALAASERDGGSMYQQRETNIPINLRTTTPVEIQLVRNYEDNIELIKGVNNLILGDGRPENKYVMDSASLGVNYWNVSSSFPHEKAGSCYYYGQGTDMAKSFGTWFYAPPTDITQFGDELNKRLYNFEEGNNMGYLYHGGRDGAMAYDPCVSPIFICGFTSMGNNYGGGCASVIKNGYSWNKSTSERYDSLYNNAIGYYKGNTPYRQDRVGVPTLTAMTTTPSDHNKNSYLGSTAYFSYTENSTFGKLECLVKLNRNDVLQLFAVQRDYNLDGKQKQYAITSQYNLTIEAISPKSYENVKAYTVNTPTDYSADLKLSNFFNKETKISDWVQSIVDAFNLEVIQYGKTVELNIKKKLNDNILAAVDVDDRVNSDEAESKKIEYPKSMAVKYKIDEDEWGFERSAVNAAGGDESILNNDDWKKYADCGYTTIQLNDDSYVTSTSDKNLKFSYTWYDTFHWYGVNDKFEKTTDTAVELRLPVISKFTYMIDGYDYEESMKHDGYGLAQRFWFKPSNSGCYVWTRTYPPERVFLYLPTNLYTNYMDVYLNLSYKNTENSLLNQFFNINAYLASNYVLIDVYLSADEYNMIKNGALVHFDSDLYIPVEVSGYDPSGNNATTLKLMKKVA